MGTRLRSPVMLAAVWVAIPLVVGGVVLAFWLHGQSLAAKGLYRVGVDTVPPYSIVYPDGSAGGLFVDVINAAARRSGIRVQWTPVSLPYDQALDRRVVDIWPGMLVTPDRQARYHVTVPWLETTSFLRWLRGHPRHTPAPERVPQNRDRGAYR